MSVLVSERPDLATRSRNTCAASLRAMWWMRAARRLCSTSATRADRTSLVKETVYLGEASATLTVDRRRRW